MADLTIMKGAEPWGADGDETGVLFIHGFTGTPQSLRYWAEQVAADGRTVLLPRLPGHGTTVQDLQNTKASEWVAEAEMSLQGLFERCERVFVCALSFGGTISLDLAARFREQIAGLVLVNPSVYTRDPRAKLKPILGRLPLVVNAVGNDVADPNTQELAYTKTPTKAAAQVLTFMDVVRARLGSVTSPLLVMTSRQDHIVDPGNGPYVIDHVASKQKELIWLERSYHVAPIDHDKDLIVERTNTFIKEQSA